MRNSNTKAYNGQAKASRGRDAVRESLKMAVSDKSVRKEEEDAEAHATVHDRKRTRGRPERLASHESLARV